MDRYRNRCLCFLPVVGGKQMKDLLPPVCLVGDHGVAGPVIHTDLGHGRSLLQVGLQKIGLLKGHPVLKQMDPHTPV